MGRACFWLPFGVGAFALVACTSDEGPPPERSVLQTVPRRHMQTDCVSGEQCLDGICRQPTADFDASIGDPAGDCLPSCNPGEMCLSGVCYATATAIDAGGPPASDPCGFCLPTETCDSATGTCSSKPTF